MLPHVLEATRSRVVARLERGRRYQTWVLLTALTGMFATTFPVTILTVSLGDIAREFGVRETLLTWVISGPLLASALALPVLGKVGDLYGHRRVFLAGFAAATVVAALTASAWDAVALIGFRTVAQVIGAATQPTSMALIMHVYPPRRRAQAIGWWSLVAAGAPAIGLVAGGPLVELVGWRIVFILQAAFAFIALGVATLVLRETTTKERVRFDIPGSVALAAGTGGVMVLLSQGPELGWTHVVVLAAAAVAPMGFVAFVRAERRTDHPLLPLEFFERRNFTVPIVVALFSGAAYMGGFILAPLLMRFVLGYSLSATALVMVLRPLSYSLSSPVGGFVATRIGERGTAVFGQATLTAALLLFSIGAAGRSVVMILAALFLQGVGNGVSRPPLTASLVNSVTEEDLGIVTASQRMVYQVGGSFGIAVLTVVYAGVNTPAAFSRAYLVGTILAGIGLVASAFLRSVDHDEEERLQEMVALEEMTEPAGG